MALTPFQLKVSRNHFRPPAGTWTNFFRPHQNRNVAMHIKTPGTPKARCGPYHSRNQGVNSVEIKAPTLIEK